MELETLSLGYVFWRNGETYMNKEDVIKVVQDFTINSPGNYISKDVAMSLDCIDMKIYEAPILGFGAVDDEIYQGYKSDDVIGSHFLEPTEWLPSAKTVISIFYPYTEKIKRANSLDKTWPASEWLHGRYEGQQFIVLALENLVVTITKAGFETIAPSLDKRYHTGSHKDKDWKKDNDSRFTSNWSERHVAYACGLGTFGLSKGLITKRGMAGRFGSVVTQLDLPKDARSYKDVYEYCTMCGACKSRCPVGAISAPEGKQLALCSSFLDKVGERNNPRYGCGKCQVGVPCTSEIPAKLNI